MEPLMPLEPTSKLANSMSEKMRNVFFDKIWVVHTDKFNDIHSAKFDNWADTKNYIANSWPIHSGKYQVFEGKKHDINIQVVNGHPIQIVEDENLGNNIDIKG